MTRARFLGVFTVCACEAPWSEMEVEFGVNVNVRISTREHGISWEFQSKQTNKQQQQNHILRLELNW